VFLGRVPQEIFRNIYNIYFSFGLCCYAGFHKRMSEIYIIYISEPICVVRQGFIRDFQKYI